MLRKSLVLLFVIGALSTFALYGSALFTDSVVVDDNTFTTGTLDLQTNPATTLVTFNNMAPGDQFTAPLTVTNGGSLELRYAVQSTTTDPDEKNLAGQLVLTIKKYEGECNNTEFASDPSTPLYTGSLGTEASAPIIGDMATGQDTGDRVLPPSTNNSEVLCFNVALPAETSNTFQNASTTATFSFVAEQTKNN